MNEATNNPEAGIGNASKQRRMIAMKQSGDAGKWNYAANKFVGSDDFGVRVLDYLFQLSHQGPAQKVVIDQLHLLQVYKRIQYIIRENFVSRLTGIGVNQGSIVLIGEQYWIAGSRGYPGQRHFSSGEAIADCNRFSKFPRLGYLPIGVTGAVVFSDLALEGILDSLSGGTKWTSISYLSELLALHSLVAWPGALDFVHPSHKELDVPLFPVPKKLVKHFDAQLANFDDLLKIELILNLQNDVDLTRVENGRENDYLVRLLHEIGDRPRVDWDALFSGLGAAVDMRSKEAFFFHAINQIGRTLLSPVKHQNDQN